MRAATAALLLVALGGRPAGAQMPPRNTMVEAWTRSRANVLAYLDAMPDSALRFRPTPGVRDFAQQLLHLSTTNRQALDRLEEARPVVGPPDTAAILRDRRSLRAYVDRSYGDVLTYLRATTDRALLESSELYGQRMPRWQWFEVLREHATWTLGQTVPYLRLNGVTPPAYLPF